MTLRRTVEGRSLQVALVRPPVVVLPGSLATHGPTPPLGLAYVAAAARAAGHTVSLVDAPGEAIDRCEAIDSPVGTLHRIGLPPCEVVARIPDDVDVVGITNMFLHEWPQVREISAAIRARFPEALVVVGGENATAFAAEILRQAPAVDLCVLGEGEATLVDVLDRWANGDDLRGTPGTMTRTATRFLGRVGTGGTSGSVVDGGLSVRIGRKELRSVPRPAWDLVPLERYWQQQPYFGVNRGRSMQVLGTRGCPYRCTFCSSPQMWTTKFVTREPADVADEIAGYVQDHGVRNVNFVDLTAATNRRWILGLCDELEDRVPGITWQLPVGTRIEGIDAHVLRRLHDTGCRNITFAPESGSQRMLDIMQKRASLTHILASVGDAAQVGLRTTVNIIVGHPEERWSDTWDSLRFLVRSAAAGADDCAVIMFCPYPGSADFDALVAAGRHRIDEAALYVGLSRSSGSHQSWNPRMSPRQIRLAQLVLIGAFYGAAVLRRPARVIELVSAQVGGDERTYLDQMLRTRRLAPKPTAPTPGRRRRIGALALWQRVMAYRVDP